MRAVNTISNVAFATLGQRHVGALLVGPDNFFTSRRNQLAALAARYAVPTMYGDRQYAVAGGLMSYNSSLTDIYRQVGVYTGKILTAKHRRLADSAADEIRTGHQPQDRQGTWPHRAVGPTSRR